MGVPSSESNTMMAVQPWGMGMSWNSRKWPLVKVREVYGGYGNEVNNRDVSCELQCERRERPIDSHSQQAPC